MNITRKTIYLLGFILAMGTSSKAQDQQILEHVDNAKEYTTFQLAHMDKELSTFMNLFNLSGLETSLLFTDEHTLMIPTNEAFKDMSIEDFAHLTNPENKADLINFINNHNLSSKIWKNELANNDIISNPEDEDIAITADNGQVTLGGARIIVPNIEASNGVIHVVDSPISTMK